MQIRAEAVAEDIHSPRVHVRREYAFAGDAHLRGACIKTEAERTSKQTRQIESEDAYIRAEDAYIEVENAHPSKGIRRGCIVAQYV